LARGDIVHHFHRAEDTQAEHGGKHISVCFGMFYAFTMACFLYRKGRTISFASHSLLVVSLPIDHGRTGKGCSCPWRILPSFGSDVFPIRFLESRMAINVLTLMNIIGYIANK
jgi:hypothetical protein